MKKIKWALLLPDLHHPYQNKKCLKAIFKWLREYGKKIHYLILTGDQMDFESISHWLKDKTRVLEGKRLIADYQKFDKDILTPLENYVRKDCQKIYLLGNHEDWVTQAIDRNPQGEGYWEINKNLHLKDRGWKIIHPNGYFNLGKLTIIHGVYTNEFHAKKTVQAFCCSVAYGHTHDVQEYTQVTSLKIKDIHKAHSIGCLCDKNPDYMKNRPNKWVHAFMVVDLSPNGEFTEHTINIINGKFRWHGKLYQ